MGTLGRALDVLRVIIAPLHNHDILEATGHVQLPVGEQAQIAGAQERARHTRQGCAKVGGGGLGVVPVPHRHTVPLHPDLPLGGRRTGRERDRVDNGQLQRFGGHTTRRAQCPRDQARRRTLVGGSTGHEQRTLGQAVTWHEHGAP